MNAFAFGRDWGFLYQLFNWKWTICVRYDLILGELIHVDTLPLI